MSPFNNDSLVITSTFIAVVSLFIYLVFLAPYIAVTAQPADNPTAPANLAGEVDSRAEQVAVTQIAFEEGALRVINDTNVDFLD